MKTFKIYIYTLLALVWVSACKPSFDTPAPSRGSADFTRYIAVGNSLTAGYADGGLYRSGQLNSYPNMIATQMQAAGGGSFAQSLFTTDQANGSGYLRLKSFDASGNPVIDTVKTNVAVRGTATIPGLGTILLYTKYSGALENYGVPGIKLNDIQNALYGNGNPYYERLLPGNAGTNTTQYLDFITAKSFTFFTNWLGNNDALGYATSGGAGDVLTDKTTFGNLYSTLLTRLTAGGTGGTGAKGACATIPDVTTIPYFTTVTVGAVLAGVQKAVPSIQAIYINAATNAAATTYAPRPATANDLLVLTFQGQLSAIGKPTTGNPYPYGLDPRNAIESKYVLDQNEAALVKDYVNSYNATIKATAAAKGLAVFDAFTFLTNVKTSGLVIDGISFNSNYISGGLFSLDGVHLTPRGYAIVANEFIKAINSKYGSSLSIVNVGAYNGIVFP
ncbi:SGNH/GDSL hydrolase family protein [Mucilaginibacter paludis]|uniref:Lipolytic protein G-D-S-L family n=1 Tax=Mucilaginibacter paludis DSM 18603 TaxID=714943 RepID=H1Y537_9SPHI|nr:SGNH/GDSL hydrolase family protein [Mucilaginibacter paludis]EHQ28580.1 hypothetical protein Mucpa_4490 [Mucilaginibacter paludis DSM 18603]